MICAGVEALKHAGRSANLYLLQQMEHGKVSAELTVQCSPVGQATCPAWALPGSFVAKVAHSG